MDSVVLITGSDSHYYALLAGAIGSLDSARKKYRFDVVVLDFGLTSEQVQSLTADFGVRVVEPQWHFQPPANLDHRRNLAFATRCRLPQIVPGYDIYFWLDSDAWIQDDDFFEAYVEPARQGKIAIVNEKEPDYLFDWRLERWTLGNLVLVFGPWQGWRLYRAPAINNGVFAAPGNSPMWGKWAVRLEYAMLKTGKCHMDQHTLLATIHQDHIPVHYLSGRYNWICSRARPMFDSSTHSFCTPRAPHERIAVMHLAGPSKSRSYEMDVLQGGKLERHLLFQPPVAATGD